MKVLVTGAAGFIGKNLIFNLRNNGYGDITAIDQDSSEDQLRTGLSVADFVFHLAGVNRPKTEDEFWRGNVEFTERLVELIKASGRRVPVLFTSSIQAELDNPYGRSKKRAEEILLEYSRETGAKVFIYRLPNVFGKWSKPNYNSVVATFCHNIARGLPIQIHDSTKELTLVYIDDVVKEFFSTMERAEELESGYRTVLPVYKTTVGTLAEKIREFAESRKNLKMPSLKDEFDKKLYATFTSFLPSDELDYGLEMKKDQRGWLVEFIKSDHFGQIFISKTEPGVTRGNHWHQTKVEKFLVVQGEAVIRLRKVDSDEVVEYRVSGNELRVIDIPPGYTHSITNVGTEPLITLFWASEIFDPQAPDTYRMEV